MISRNLRLTMRHKLRFAEANAGVAMPVNGVQSNVYALSKENLMKKSMLLLVVFFIFTSVALKAQSPQKINFQSIVRNTNGVIVSNKSVSFKITILSGSTTGTPVYSETHLKTTDAIGLVSLQIGSGTVSSGIFSSLNWGNASHFIKLEADFTGGNTYVTLGTQELMSVPYAMYAAKTDTNSLNLTNRFAEKAPINNPEFTGQVSGITKTMVGLGNVDNTSDASKPVSSATQTALDAKAPLASPTFTGTVGGITKTMVGLGSVDNTTDASKPVSTATQAALDAKVNILDTSSMLSKYLRKADFPSGSSANEILYWNGTKWISLSPGTTGQALIMSSTGLQWGCIITNSAASPSTTPSLVATTPLTPITIATTGATGIGSATGLPAGVTAVWLADVITISGTPTAAGTFNYTIPLTGGCGSVSATGIITVTPAPCPATITYNSHAYKAVELGTQCWMAENLRTRKYNDGTDIPFDASGGVGGNGSDQTWSALQYGAHTIYRHDSTPTTGNLAKYGYLYNWYAVKGITSGETPTKNICPDGWHVPTGSDWNKLVKSLDSGADTISNIPKIQSTTAGTILKSTGSGGFSALLGGFRAHNDGAFNSINGGAFYWSATEVPGGVEYRYLFSGNDGSVLKTGGSKPVGMSVRCLRD